jgi:membrane-associated phospholipid phosphatase
MRTKIYPVCTALLLAAFLAASSASQFDRGGSDWLHDCLRPIDRWLQILTYAGDSAILIPICVGVALLLFLMKRKASSRAFFVASVAVLASGLVAQILKVIIGRARPYTFGDGRYTLEQLQTFQWFTHNSDFASFPSGHATAIFSVIWVLQAQLKQSWAKALLFTFACLVALSRVALWKHYLADVVAGAVLGILCANALMQKLRRKKA